jgi:hypothetical protein
LVVKYTGKGQTFQVATKGTLTYAQNDKKEDVLKSSSEVKVITNVEGKNVETKFDSKGIRSWIELGTYDIWRPFNFTAKVKTNSTFDFATGWVAAEYKGKHCDAHLRTELKRGNAPHFNAKVVLTEGDWKFGVVGKVGLNGFTLRRHNFFGHYHHKDFDLYVEHVDAKSTPAVKEGEAKPLFNLATFVAAAVYRLNKHTLVAKGSYEVASKNWDLTLGGITSVNDKTDLRAKVNKAADLTLATRYRHNSNVSFVLSGALNLKDPKFPTGRAVPVPGGLTVELTYN